MEYPRSDGRKGIRNVIVIAYLVECAHHVAREIALNFRVQDVHVIGFPGCYPNDYSQRMSEIAELMACGAHLTYFVTGRGSVVGSAISPVLKICANPETFSRMSDDMDVNAGRILQGIPLSEVADEIYLKTLAVAAGALTASEALGHQEFILTYKSFAPLGPSCLPAA